MVKYNMVSALYTEVHVMCIVCLSVFLRSYRKNSDSRIVNILLQALLALFICLFSINILCNFTDSGQWLVCHSLHVLLCTVSIILSGAAAFLWLLFTESKLNGNRLPRRKHMLVAILPVSFFLILVVFLIRADYPFFAAGHSVSQQGASLFLMPAIILLYLTLSAVRLVYYGYGEKIRIRRSELFFLAAIVILPVSGELFELFFPGIPVTCACVTLAFLVIFLKLQEQQISRDELTGLNNRRQIDNYLATKLSEPHKKGELYFVLLDVNSFKHINDTYGHLEGDRALQLIAAALKQVCGTGNDFIARYGGDEFAVICERLDLSCVQRLHNDIEHCLRQLVSLRHIPYSLTLSMGCTRFAADGSITTRYGIIAAADRDLYLAKQKLHKQSCIGIYKLSAALCGKV